jgi:NAD(P)H-hydrate repair Nnr-like enzyme with NAD(P)H-hydrate dehydratase domain
MIGTFLAQRVAPWWAGACAAYLHGLSADRLRDRMGERAMLPSEVAENLREAWNETHGPATSTSPLRRRHGV